jgi:hypothetical protein
VQSVAMALAVRSRMSTSPLPVVQTPQDRLLSTELSAQVLRKLGVVGWGMGDGDFEHTRRRGLQPARSCPVASVGRRRWMRLQREDKCGG